MPTTSGGNNTAAYGQQALASNTTSSSNTALGAGAMQANITGSQNTATGQGALVANTIGNLNTSNGINSLFHVILPALIIPPSATLPDRQTQRDRITHSSAILQMLRQRRSPVLRLSAMAQPSLQVIPFSLEIERRPAVENTSGTITAGGFSGNGSGLTNVTASNATQLETNTWEAPGIIGSTTPNSGSFTTLTASGNVTVSYLSTFSCGWQPMQARTFISNPLFQWSRCKFYCLSRRIGKLRRQFHQCVKLRWRIWFVHHAHGEQQYQYDGRSLSDRRKHSAFQCRYE